MNTILIVSMFDAREYRIARKAVFESGGSRYEIKDLDPETYMLIEEDELIAKAKKLVAELGQEAHAPKIGEAPGVKTKVVEI